MSLHPIEAHLIRALRSLLVVGAPASLLLLLLPTSESQTSLLWFVLGHLVIMQAVTFWLVVQMSKSELVWFPGLHRSWLATQASIVAITVGFSALLTLATSAAARYEPSLQFLQLLSSLDIAWVVAATFLGASALWGRRVGLVSGSVVLIVCVASIAVYLSIVGFTDEGGWLVDGAQLMRVVIPSDVMAAIIAVSLLLSASRRSMAEHVGMEPVA